MKTKYIILASAIAILLLIQLFPGKPENKKSLPENDIFSVQNAEPEIKQIIKTSCYDCHSYETKFPAYSKIVPVSWIINSHIKEGRKHLNFSEWKNYQPEVKIFYAQACIEEIKDGKMPLGSYTLIHSEAKITAEKQTKLIRWFTSESNVTYDTEQ